MELNTRWPPLTAVRAGPRERAVEDRTGPHRWALALDVVEAGGPADAAGRRTPTRRRGPASSPGRPPRPSRGCTPARSPHRSELQALQADVEQLSRHQRDVEDSQLAAMERREPLDAPVAELETDAAAALTPSSTRPRARRSAAKRSMPRSTPRSRPRGRGAPRRRIAPDLVAAYERCREKANGVGAARLVGTPARAATSRSRRPRSTGSARRADASIEHCDNCGAILIA